MIPPLLEQAAKAVWRARIDAFLPLWTTMTAAASIAVAWSINHAGMVKVPQQARLSTAFHGARPESPTRGAAPALISLLLFVAGYITITSLWEDFTYYDNSMFTLYSLKGHNIGLPIWRENGRFFPFGHQEFNLIRHFTSTAAGYHLWPAVELLMLCGLLLLLDDQLSIAARAALTAISLITPGIVVTFSSLIFPERNVMLWLVLLAICVKRLEQTQTARWGVAAVICAQVLLYYKETAFFLILGFAVGRLLLRCRSTDRQGWNFDRLKDRESRLDVCLASIAILFLIYYVAVMFPHPKMQYAEIQRISLAQVLISYLKADPLTWLLLALLAGRLYLILRRRTEPALLWDGLALGCAACFFSYLYLHMFASNYLAPIDLVAALYIGRFAILSWGKMQPRTRLAVGTVLSFVLLQELSLTIYSVFEQKNIVHEKTEIARVIEARYQRGPGTLRLFFPFAKPSLVMEFASYLSYLGVPVEGVDSRQDHVVLISDALERDGLCVDYQSVTCHAGRKAYPGDFVVVLPDDEATLAEVMPYRSHGELLASYAPRPGISRYLTSLRTVLHVGPPRLVRGEVPDRWLEAAVFVSK